MKVLITGGSRGIGKAIAEELANAGHDLLLVARNPQRLENTANEIRTGAKVEIEHFVCDVGNINNLESLHEFCIKNNFIPNVLVLSAGIFLEGFLVDSQTEDYNETLNINLHSIYHTVKLFVNELKSKPASKIILIGSTAAYEAYPLGSLYGVAKWALRGYAVNLRKELMNDGVAVTFLSPGGTWTDLWAGEDLPDDRLLEARDIGKLVAAILSLSNQAVVEELIVRPMLGDIHE